jgi:hypothetical protein
MQSSCKILTVPTKIYDGGSSSSHSDGAKRRKSFPDSFEHHGHYDAFSFYSSQERRMSALLGQNQEVVNSSPTPIITAMEKITDHQPAQRTPSNCESDKNARRTRVSFELHPSLLVWDFLRSGGTEN